MFFTTRILWPINFCSGASTNTTSSLQDWRSKSISEASRAKALAILIGKGVVWLDLGSFDRRDLLVRYKDQILGAVQGAIVFSDGIINCDQKAVLNILRTEATLYFTGI